MKGLSKPMKYYSEKLNKVFDTVDALEKAEAELEAKNAEKKKKAEARATRAKEVEDAYKTYRTLLDAFCKDYGAFHTSYSTSDLKNGSLLDALFDLL